MSNNQKQDASLLGYSAGLKNYRSTHDQFNPYDKGTKEYLDFQAGFEDGVRDSQTHWTESKIFEARGPSFYELSAERVPDRSVNQIKQELVGAGIRVSTVERHPYEQNAYVFGVVTTDSGLKKAREIIWKYNGGLAVDIRESVVNEGRMKELDMDIKDKKMSEEEFKKKYGMTKSEAKKRLSAKKVKESVGTQELVYKHWNELTPQEKIQSANYGKGKTFWNPETRRYAVKYPVPANSTMTNELSLEEETTGITADQLSIGDPVIITGDVNFHGATGDIDSFGRDKSFVVVNLYNHGRRSFHSSDVTFNDYAGSEDELDHLDRVLEDVQVLEQSDRWSMALSRKLK